MKRAQKTLPGCILITALITQWGIRTIPTVEELATRFTVPAEV